MKGNEPAFPVNDNGLIKYGLTKREYFAGLAMQGYIAAHAHPQALNPPEEEKAATHAVLYADALIAELNKE